jgi:flavin reductase (DIM6/NTAB) family NADH-FMN oxidoreductase RutF
MKRVFVPEKTDPKDLHQLLLGAVAPRPIAFVSSYGENGIANLAPYSYFVAISSNPPIVAFSVSRKKGDAPDKDSLLNAKVKQELVINTVHYGIAQQMVLTSIAFDRGIDEFKKSGLTSVPALKVDAPMVEESYINLECRVREIKNFGNHPGAGNLVICDVVHIHINRNILGEGDRIDPFKADILGRLGRAFYTRVTPESIEKIYQNTQDEIIGFDALPNKIRSNSILSGNEIAQMAKLTLWPNPAEIEKWKKRKIKTPEEEARRLIKDGQAQDALALLMAAYTP